MSAKIEFGMFDWVDRARKSVSDLYESRLKLIESADQAGFYGYHLAEHHSTPLGMAPSPSVFLGALAQRTKNIRFSPMAYLLPMYHPLRLIEEVCMLDHLSNGRMELGISRGVSPYEVATYGLDPKKNQEIFTEVLEIFRKGILFFPNYIGDPSWGCLAGTIFMKFPRSFALVILIFPVYPYI